MKFEAFTEGQTFETKPVPVTKEAIISFAKHHDPQYFHIDENTAKESPFGGLIASGFHTLSAVWVEWVKMDILGQDCLGGMGMNRLAWKTPVYPNDTLQGEFSVLKKRQLDDNRGVLTLGLKIANQHEKEVLSCEMMVLLKV